MHKIRIYLFYYICILSYCKTFKLNIMRSKFILTLTVIILTTNLILLGSNKEVDISSVKSDNWQLYSTQDGVEIYYKLMECNDPTNGIYKEIVALKVVNTNSYKVRVQWENQLWYGNNCVTCGQGKENFFKKELNSQETIESSCDMYPEINLFVRYTNHEKIQPLTRFELADIKVVKK